MIYETDDRTACSWLGNIAWLFFGGFVSALLWAFVGILLCLTIIGIPFGLQCIKIAQFVLLPFGKHLEETNYDEDERCLSCFGNLLWLPVGIIICIVHVVHGILLILTIIGIPFALQHFKLAKLALMPFGSDATATTYVMIV